MAKNNGNKRKGLASMDTVANVAPEEPHNDVSTEDSNETIDDIVNVLTTRKKPKPKRQVAVWLSEDVYKAYNRYAREYGKGAKSELAERLLRPALRKSGHLNDRA